MNVENTTSENNINFENYLKPQNQTPFATLRQNSPFKFELDKLLSCFQKEKIESKEDEINKLFLDLDFGAQYDVDTKKINQADAMFFINMLNQNGLVNYTVEDNSLEITTKNANKIEASNVLLDMLKTSYDTKKPIRMDFDNNVTVILKLDDAGKINAHFIPGDKAVEEYLKNNIPSLRQRFDEQNISYSNINYGKYKDQKENSKDKKEK